MKSIEGMNEYLTEKHPQKSQIGQSHIQSKGECFNDRKGSVSQLPCLSPLSPKINPIQNGSNPSLLCLNNSQSYHNLSCPHLNIENSDEMESANKDEEEGRPNLSVKAIRRMMNRTMIRKISRALSGDTCDKPFGFEEEEVHIDMEKNNDYDYDDLVLINYEDNSNWDHPLMRNEDKREKRNDYDHDENYGFSIYQILNQRQSQW